MPERLIDANALYNDLKESARAAREWKEEAQDEEIRIRAEQTHGTFCECALRVKNAPTISDIDRAAILRQCNEIERAVNELYVKRLESITSDERIALINMLGVIVAEITAAPKTNGDRIRQMTDEGLAEFIAQRRTCDTCCITLTRCITTAHCKDGVLEWLKQEVSEDADN